MKGCGNDDKDKKVRIVERREKSNKKVENKVNEK